MSDRLLVIKVAPDLVRPPMETGPAPAAGKRVRVVAPGFEHTQVYHPLYLPSEWKHAAQKYPVIVEYMGNVSQSLHARLSSTQG